jgi:hypothetical protein
MNVLVFLKTKLLTDKLLFVYVLIAISIPNVLAIFFSFAGIDACGYYLPLVERLNEGFVLYRDVPSGYTPLVPYLFLLLKKIFGISSVNYEFYETVHFIFQYVSAFYIYKITLLLTRKKPHSLLAVLLFFFAIHWNEGEMVLLEVPSVMFGLAAIYYALISKKAGWFIGVGALVAAAFLCKQYGIGFFFLTGFVICFSENKWKKILYYILGFGLPLTFCILYFGDSFVDFLINTQAKNISGQGYGGVLNYSQHTKALLFFFYRIFPNLLIAIVIFFLTFKQWKQKSIYIMLLLGVFGFSLQFLYAKLAHYYIYMIPFACVFSACMLQGQTNKAVKYTYLIFVVLSVLLLFRSTYYNRVLKVYLKTDIRKNQYETAEKIKAHISTGSTIYIADIGIVTYYYLANVIPPNMNYAFGPAINSDSVYQLNACKLAEFVLRDMKEADYFNYYSKEVEEFLATKQYVEIKDSLFLYTIKYKKQSQ